MSAVLRVFGAHLDVDRIRESVSPVKVESVWRVGEINRLGKHNSTSGVTVLLSDLEKSDEMVSQVNVVLNDLSPHLSEFIRDGTVGEVDFALFVGAMKSCSLVLESDTLRAIERGGLRIVVSAYPVEDSDGVGSG